MASRKNIDIHTAEIGKDYFIRIKDVLDKINLRNDDDDASLADRYRRAISNSNFRSTLSPSLRQRQIVGSPKLDLSWKNGGKQFPKKSSRIGADYQVSNIPSSNIFSLNGNSENET